MRPQYLLRAPRVVDDRDDAHRALATGAAEGIGVPNPHRPTGWNLVIWTSCFGWPPVGGQKLGVVAWRGSGLRPGRSAPKFLPVKLSVKTDYAARAVLGLARHYPTGESLRAEDLAAQQTVPLSYLAQILSDLRAQGIVQSVRGKTGGYLLARPPAQITLGDVLRAAQGAVMDTSVLSEKECPPELRRAWTRLRHTLEAAAEATTFQQLVEEGADKDKMYYI